jgi:hypothetical protein
MSIRHWSAAAALALVLLVSGACGGSDATDFSKTTPSTATATRTVAAAKTPSPAGTPGGFGPAPKLGGNVVKVSPAHGATVTQASTRSPIADRPGGVCFEADFTDLPENALWFRMALDDQEVTVKLTWVVASKDAPPGGRACYAPAEGIAVGRHTAAVSVQNPNSTREPTRQLVAWGFEVSK